MFWAVLAGFLVVDNLVLVPAGCDHLRHGRRARLRYEPAARMQALGRDLVALNPLNPFDRIAITTRALGPITGAQLRRAHLDVRARLGRLNALAGVGLVYLLVLLMLMGLSAKLHFGVVLALLAGGHLVFWSIALWLLVRGRAALGLDAARVTVLAAEALFVPAYTINLGKRASYRHRLDLPALALGLRQVRGIAHEGERELYSVRLATRLDDLACDLDPTDVSGSVGAGPVGALGHWVEQARQCLKASAPAAGS